MVCPISFIFVLIESDEKADVICSSVLYFMAHIFCSIILISFRYTIWALCVYCCVYMSICRRSTKWTKNEQRYGVVMAIASRTCTNCYTTINSTPNSPKNYSERICCLYWTANHEYIIFDRFRNRPIKSTQPRQTNKQFLFVQNAKYREGRSWGHGWHRLKSRHDIDIIQFREQKKNNIGDDSKRQLNARFPHPKHPNRKQIQTPQNNQKDKPNWLKDRRTNNDDNQFCHISPKSVHSEWTRFIYLF